MATASERPTPVRLVVTTDWYVGGSVLVDVPPGGEYETTTEFPHPIAIYTIKVLGFELSWISVGDRRFEPKIIVGGDDCEYRFDPPLEVSAYKQILLHLRNHADAPRAPKIAMIDDSVIEPHAPRRASEFTAVAPPQEPTLTAADGETPPTGAEAVPSSVFTDVTLRGGAIAVAGSIGGSASMASTKPFSSTTPPPAYRAQVDAKVAHRPLLTRTLVAESGNVIDVRGCSCRADIVSVEAFAAHVEWPVEAVQAQLALVGIAYDLLDRHELRREDVLSAIAHYTEVRR